MDHVLWIGGPPGAGKSTLATRLMRRHGLRLYSADTATWSHRDRALAAGSPAARRWEALTPEARVEQPPSELLAMSLHRERAAMVAEDLRGFPTAPLVVAEGTVIVPSSVPVGASAVWILPTPERQERQLMARDGRPNALYRLLSEEIGAEVQAASVSVIAIDGVIEMVAQAEGLFADVLDAGPRAETVVERQALLREANLAHVAQVRGRYARPWATGNPEAIERSFICECGDQACETDVRLTVRHVAAAPALAPGHHS